MAAIVKGNIGLVALLRANLAASSALLATLLGSGGTLPPSGDAGALQIGLVETDLAYYSNTSPMVDLARPGADHIRSNATVANPPVPIENRDSDGNVISLPTDATQVSFVIQTPGTNDPITITWDPIASGPPSPSINGAAPGSVVWGTNSVTFTPEIVQPSTGVISFNWAPDGTNSAKNFSTGGSGLDARYLSNINNFVMDGAWDRYVKYFSVESLPVEDFLPNPFGGPGAIGSMDSIKFPVTGDGQMLKPLWTAALRNRNLNDPGYLDGARLETVIEMATLKPGNPWFNAPVNAEASYFTGDGTNVGVAELWAQFAAATGKSVAVELGNEAWNTGLYWTAHQFLNEAVFLGIETHEHYAQRAETVFGYFRDAFSAAGVLDKLYPVLAWQNASGSILPQMLAAMTDPSIVRGFAVAPYFVDLDPGIAGGMASQGFGSGYTGDAATFLEASFPDVDRVYDQTEAHYADAQAAGIDLYFYEWGWTAAINDDATRIALNTHPLMHDLYMYAFQEARRRFPGTHLNSFTYTFPLTGSTSSFGLMQYTYQTLDLANTPKAQAQKEYVNGTRMLFDAVAIPSGTTVRDNSPAGTVVASLAYLVEAVITVTDPSGYFTYDDATKTLRLAAGVKLPGDYLVDITQTYAAALNGPSRTNSVSLTIAPSVPMDDFNDGTVSSIWGADTAFVPGFSFNGSGAETGGQYVITPEASNPGAFSHVLADAYDVSDQAFYLQVVTDLSALGGSQVFQVTMGPDKNNQYTLAYFNGNLILQTTVAGTKTDGASFAYSNTTHRWWRFRPVSADGKVYVDTAPSTASVPPVEGDWTQRGFFTEDNVNIDLGASKFAITNLTFAPVASPIAVAVDGFNTAP